MGTSFTSGGPGVYSNYTSVILDGYYESRDGEGLVLGSDQSVT